MNQLDDSSAYIGLGCALETFTEVEEVKHLINNIKSVYSNIPLAEKALERFIFILNPYQEQPHLLDKSLDDILTSMTNIIRNDGSPDTTEVQHEVFKYMHIVMKVRGNKVVINYLPHEVADLEPVLQLLERQDPHEQKTWQTRYCLILWLSIIVFIPFHMSKLDSFNVPSTESQLTVRQRILNICKIYCLRPDVCRVAALLSSYFLKRSDVKNEYLAPFISWACDQLLEESKSVSGPCGPQAAISAILKHGDREDLLPLAPFLLKTIIESDYKENNSSLIRKFGIKIIQRIGLTFLPERVAIWRYQRGNRSLEANLAIKEEANFKKPSEIDTISKSKNSNLSVSNNVNTSDADSSDETEYDIPDEIETVIEELIQGLRFSDTISRWSAAKGIGRVTNRLPRDLANDVVGSVLELLSYREKDGAWHGGCLALAELGRRGLLLPERLETVVPKVLQALMYDEWRTFSSVGSNVRDAACFVSWSFARAFESHIIAPYVQQIASTLLVVVCFDREVNCRRAASAAFQENVGRQGAFPHGIDIVNEADYTAVGARSHSFLEISMFITQFEEYVYPLVDHLLTVKIYHWDPSVRELAAKSIFNLAPRNPALMVNALEKLCSDTDSIDLNVRHGAVLAVADILHALTVCKKSIPDVMQGIPGLESEIEKVYSRLLVLMGLLKGHQHFRGIGGELMKQACCYLIEKCSYTDLCLEKFSNLLSVWHEFLYDCLRDDSEPVRVRASAALSAVFSRWYSLTPAELNVEEYIIQRNELAKRTAVLYSRELLSDHEVMRRGFALSINQFPKPFLMDVFEGIFPSLLECCKITPSTEKWAESRRESIKALTSVGHTLDADLFHGNVESIVELLFSCLFQGFDDYTRDKRGDIGAWVREAVMTGLQVLVNLLVVNHPDLLTEERVTKVLAGLAQQAVEKIDRTRAHAGMIFASIVHNTPVIPNLLHHEELKAIFPEDICNEKIIWISATETFPRFTELLKFPCFTYNVLQGLVLSVGGITESLVKNASLSLFSYMKSKQDQPEELERLCATISQIFQDNQHNDLIVIPMLSFLDRLISSNCIRVVLDNQQSTFATSILSHIRIEVNKSRVINKLMAAVSVLCQLIQVPGEVSKRSLYQLSIFLNNRFVYIRKSTASHLYEALTLFGDESAIPLENLDEVISLLSSTNWEADVSIIKPTRNQICDLMGIQRPVPFTK